VGFFFFFALEVLRALKLLPEKNHRPLGSMVAVAFQIIFRAEMHTNDIFLFLKNYF
jgi:hypothetical protein